MTKEDKIKEYSQSRFPPLPSGIGYTQKAYNDKKEEAIEAFKAGYESAESNQTQIIKSALRFAKDNHNFCFPEDMMYKLFKESIAYSEINK